MSELAISPAAAKALEKITDPRDIKSGKFYLDASTNTLREANWRIFRVVFEAICKAFGGTKYAERNATGQLMAALEAMKPTERGIPRQETDVRKAQELAGEALAEIYKLDRPAFEAIATEIKTKNFGAQLPFMIQRLNELAPDAAKLLAPAEDQPAPSPAPLPPPPPQVTATVPAAIPPTAGGSPGLPQIDAAGVAKLRDERQTNLTNPRLGTLKELNHPLRAIDVEIGRQPSSSLPSPTLIDCLIVAVGSKKPLVHPSRVDEFYQAVESRYNDRSKAPPASAYALVDEVLKAGRTSSVRRVQKPWTEG